MSKLSKQFEKEIINIVERNISRKVNALMASEKSCDLQSLKRIVFGLKKIVQDYSVELLQESETEEELGFRLNHIIKLNEFFLHHKSIQENAPKPQTIYVCDLECKTKNERIT